MRKSLLLKESKEIFSSSRQRQKVKILEKYLLLDEDTINAYKNLVIVYNNPSSEEVNDDIGTQSKSKEKVKVKKRKENNTGKLLM